MQAKPQALSAAVSREALKTVGEKYTNVSLFPSFIVSLAGGTMTIALAYLLKGTVPYLYSLLLERGPLQFLTIFAFWFTMGMLIFKYRLLRRERSAFELGPIKDLAGGPEAWGTKTFVGQVQGTPENLDPGEKDLILVNRIIKAMKQLKINRNPGDVANILKTVGETDAAVMDSSYILIKFMIWAIPVLGFIGTIMGMTQAIGSFDTVLKGVGEVGFSGVKENLGLVTSGLSVAFETTFLALVLSTIVNLFSNALQKKEEDLLSDVEEFTTDNIINKYSSLRDHVNMESPDSDIFRPKRDPGMDSEGIVMELKNMNKQHQVNADEMLGQVGRVLEAIEAMPQASGEEAAQQTPDNGLQTVLAEMSDVLKGQAEFMKEMSLISDFMHKNVQVLEKLPAAIDQMDDTSRKLGELFGQIYNRPFE
jgi:hypothetical protein